MSVTLVNLSGYQRGIETNETGINCSSFSMTVEPEFKDKLAGITGETIGFAVASMRRILRIEGEINNTTGVMAIAAATAFSPANDTTYWGASSGGFYFDRGEVTQTRDGFKAMSVELSSDPSVS